MKKIMSFKSYVSVPEDVSVREYITMRRKLRDALERRASLNEISLILDPNPFLFTPDILVAHPNMMNNLLASMPRGYRREYQDEGEHAHIDKAIKNAGYCPERIGIMNHAATHRALSRREMIRLAPIVSGLYLQLREQGLTHYQIVG